MNLRLAITSGLCLAALLSAQAQTPAATPSPTKPTPKTAAKRAATYKGPKVVKDTKALGDKMIRDSKPDAQPLEKTPR
jgi:hypothetical protein